MKKIFGFLVFMFAASSANATFIFSDVSYTADSVTFTIDGDMSGYTLGSSGYRDQFSLVYGGDLWGSNYSTFEPNTWTSSVFDNESFTTDGNTGTSGNSYSWSRYGSSLADAFATNNTITLTMTNPRLNEAATNGLISFVWGNGSDASRYTVLDTVQVSSVPEPSTLALLGLGLV